MKRAHGYILIVAMALLTIMPYGGWNAMADSAWDSELGWIDLSREPDVSDRGIYAHATGLFVKGHYAAAADRYRDVEQLFPDSPLATRAQFARARCERLRERWLRAIRITDELLEGDLQPLKRDEIIRFQLDTIEMLAESSPKRAVGLARDRVERADSPDLRYAILMVQGDLWRTLEKDLLASEAYGKAITLAPDAERRGEALYRGALADLNECRENRGDAECLARALGRFTAFRRTCPDDERAASADRYISAITRAIAQPDDKRRRAFYALTYMIEKRYKKAYSILKWASWYRPYRGTRLGETALFYRAECLYLRGKVWQAFHMYERFLTEYPDSIFLHDTVRRQFEIGGVLRERGKFRKAIKAFEAAANSDPIGPLAAEAEMNAGECYMARKKYAQAKDAFLLVVETYPRGMFSDAALFKSGVAGLKSSESARNTDSLLTEARDAFEVYLNQRPDGVFATEAASLLEECRSRQARTIFATARLYERLKEPRAAAWYYRKVVREHPTTASAPASQERLAAYRKEGLRLSW